MVLPLGVLSFCFGAKLRAGLFCFGLCFIVSSLGGQRLAGGFFQLNDALAAWPSNDWVRVLDKMHELEMNTVIIQMTARELENGQTHSFLPQPGSPDAVETILTYADAQGFQVYLGLYSSRWVGSMTDSNLLARLSKENVLAATRLRDRYLRFRVRPSFAGWYLPYEPWTREYQKEEINRLRTLFSEVQQHCAAICGNGILAISPFISAERPSPCRVEQIYTDLLANSGISLLMLQDSVGAQDWNMDIGQRVRPYALAFQRACVANRARFWANLEAFRIEDFSPCDPARLRRQFDALGSMPERFVTFDFVHYMNPIVFLDSWGEDRRARMRNLYNGYKAEFVLREHPASPAPRIQAHILKGKVYAEWPASEVEIFELETTTNLLSTQWHKADSEITNSNGCDTALVGSGREPEAFFRARLLARLDLPDSMVHIPAGEFLMGARLGDTNLTSAELLSFTARITEEFWISDHEVTQSEYLNVMCVNNSARRGDLELPVESVSWNEALTYCKKVTDSERLAGRLPVNYEYRLPTEAEWEYAARGGTLGVFPFGDDPADLGKFAWHAQNSGGVPHRVRTLEQNPRGLFDTQGNVFEWCYDWLGSETPVGPIDDPCGSSDATYRAVRGGAWSFSWIATRPSWRAGFVPTRRAWDVGFRVVVSKIRQPSGDFPIKNRPRRKPWPVSETN